MIPTSVSLQCWLIYHQLMPRTWLISHRIFSLFPFLTAFVVLIKINGGCFQQTSHSCKASGLLTPKPQSQNGPRMSGWPSLGCSATPLHLTLLSCLHFIISGVRAIVANGSFEDHHRIVNRSNADSMGDRCSFAIIDETPHTWVTSGRYIASQLYC